MSRAARLLTDLKRQLHGLPQPLFIALSGGMDSMLLLEACYRLGVSLTAIHVHHGLQPEADGWVDFCRAQVARRGMLFVSERVTLGSAGNIEARARAARFSVFAKTVGQGSLLLAQHRDDQAETFLLRLMRGAGAHGLASMAAARQQGGMTLLRPLLDVSRADIEQLANLWQLDWVEDPSNYNPRFARNWVRHQLLPQWQLHTPEIKQQLARSAAHQAEAAQLLDELAEQDLAAMADAQPGLSLAALAALSPPRRNNLLRHWLAAREPYRPGEELLARVQQEVLDAAADRQPQLPLERGVLTRFLARLYWVPKAAFAKPPAAGLWQIDQSLQLGALRLQIGDRPRFVEEKTWSVPYLRCAQGAQATEVAGSMVSGCVRLPAYLTQVEVRFAQGGERLLRNGQHQQVSEHWRAAGIPPWVRRWLPLFYADGELLAAAAIGHADDGQAAVEAAHYLIWQLPQDFMGG